MARGNAIITLFFEGGGVNGFNGFLTVFSNFTGDCTPDHRKRRTENRKLTVEMFPKCPHFRSALLPLRPSPICDFGGPARAAALCPPLLPNFAGHCTERHPRPFSNLSGRK